jgi:2-methylcitrate dehydratase
MKFPRRRFLYLGAGAAALPIVSQIARSENRPTQPLSEPREKMLAERLAAYAHDLRYEDLDAATIERVKTLVIDTIGCGVGAWDERPVRICREVALSVAGPATIIGTNRRTAIDLAAFANGAAFRYLDFNDTYVGRFAVHPSDNIAALPLQKPSTQAPRSSSPRSSSPMR